MFVCNSDEQKNIISSIHIGCGDNDTACCLRSHVGVDRTRAKILVQFYWKNVGKDTKKIVLSCDWCQKVNPVHKIYVEELHPVT